jgi:hypothetical protein
MTDRRREILLLATLIAITLAFAFGVLPEGIDEGFGGEGPGLSPSAMPRLAVAGIVLALAYGLLLAVQGTKPNTDAAALHPQGAHPLRAIGAVLICLTFAQLGFELLGFYIGGVLMAMLLTLLLGERQIFKVLVIPMLVCTLIYTLFELGFQIRLPKAGFIPGLPL